MAKMRPEDMRHKIFVNYDAQPDRTDDNGMPWPDWQPLIVDASGNPRPFMAKKLGVKGFLFYQAAAVEAEQDVTYTIYYREDIKATMQILDSGETLIIKVPPVDADGRRMWLEIHAKAVLQGGG